MATTLRYEYARAMLERSDEALRDPNLPGHLERQWKRIRREALAVLSKNPEDLDQKIHIRL